MVTLRTQAGTLYQPTPEDILWLMRAVEVEGKPHDLVAQTLVNGFLWARESLNSARTLAEWVRAYAQPVSPLWMPGGEKYEQSLATADSDEEREKLRAKGWRRQQEHATRVRFSPVTVQAVHSAFAGPPRYPGAVDYGAPWLEKPSTWHAYTFPTARANENKLWARPGAQGWSGYVVDGAPDVSSKGVAGWVLAAAGIAGILALKSSSKSKSKSRPKSSSKKG